MILFTSDTHFGHKGVIRHGRPFSSVEEMDAVLIARWNERVALRDEVWHLGDFCVNRKWWNKIRPQLNGRIHLVLGNHDDPSEAAKWVESVQEVKYLRHEGLRFYLSHYAHRVWRRSDDGSFHLYGHSHGDLPGLNRSMDVCVDDHNFYPISLDEVVARLESQPITHHHRSRSDALL